MLIVALASTFDPQQSTINIRHSIINFVLIDEAGVQMVSNGGDGNFPQFGERKRRMT
jgi:hypothetical protein